MARPVEELEAEALSLPEEDQVRLFERLLVSYEGPEDEAIARAWVEEAALRDQAMECGEVPEAPTEEIFERLRFSLR